MNRKSIFAVKDILVLNVKRPSIKCHLINANFTYGLFEYEEVWIRVHTDLLCL